MTDILVVDDEPDIRAVIGDIPLDDVLAKREQMSREGGIDWAFGELLAFGSLAMEGRPVRRPGRPGPSSGCSSVTSWALTSPTTRTTSRTTT